MCLTQESVRLLTSVSEFLATRAEVAKAMGAERRIDDNWGLLVLVYMERLGAGQAYEV